MNRWNDAWNAYLRTLYGLNSVSHDALPDDLVEAWEQHLASQRAVAEKAAQNVIDAERISEVLKRLVEERRQSSSDFADSPEDAKPV